MTFRYVIRPHGIRHTPRLLAAALDAKGTRRWPSYMRALSVRPSWGEDFFLIYPEVNALASSSWTSPDASRIYRVLRVFSSSSKYHQRHLLSEFGISVPKSRERLGEGSVSPSEGEKFVVRPLRHSQGRDYRLTTSWDDFREGQEYISVLFPKRWEYRLIFCFGTPLITLIKRVPEGLSYEQPWNHANGSTFITVTNEENNRLRHTDVVERLAAYEVIQHAHLVAADILLDKDHNYAVTELNFCPALTIENNIQRVASHAQSYRQSQS
jgi:hypothetical protein